MKYQVFSEEEALDLISPGDYQAEIVEFHDTNQYGEDLVSKKGVPMVKLKLSIITPERDRFLYDYILLNKMFAFKFRHLADSIGKIKEYEENLLSPADFIGKLTYVSITIQDAKDGFPKRNSIQDYIKKENLVLKQTIITQPVETKNDDFVDSDIPF